jgi:hypothetical protein
LTRSTPTLTEDGFGRERGRPDGRPRTPAVPPPGSSSARVCGTTANGSIAMMRKYSLCG